MSSITAGTYPESVSSCHPPTPPPSPPPHPAPASALHGAPLSRRFDFADASSGGDLDYDDDDFIRAVEYYEQGYNEAKRRAPLCVCGRGVCAVERDEQRARWVYVCPSRPKCNYISVCEEVGLDPELQPTVRSHPKPSNNCVINTSSNHVAEPRRPINNVNIQGAGATTPNTVSPQATVPKIPLNSPFQNAGTTTPLHVSPNGPSATAAVKFRPQEAKSKDNQPICKCAAGKCRVLRVGSEDYYVCPIAKGQGACSYMVPVVAAANEPTETETSGDKHLKDNLVEKEVYVNNLIQGEDNNANGSVNPQQHVEKEAHGQGACSYMVPVVAAVNELTQTETSGDKHLKDNLVDKEVYGNNLIQGEDNSANGSVNPPQRVEKEAHRDNPVEAEENNITSESDDEWPFEVVDNEIVLTAQTTPSAEVRQASPSMKCETTAIAEAPTKSPVPPYGTSSPSNPRSENRVSPTGRILEACGELMLSCCSGLCPP